MTQLLYVVIDPYQYLVPYYSEKSCSHLLFLKKEVKVHCGLAIGIQIQENSSPRKKQRYLCKFNDKIAQKYFEVRRSKKGDSFAYCLTYSVGISIGNGRKSLKYFL